MTVPEIHQKDAIAFLKGHASRGASTAERVIQTHGALVFLHKDEALKIKRAVKYDYLDFSTLALRKAMLEREVVLNRDAAPGLYRDVVALTREPGGTLMFEGPGPVVEYVLRMKRFPAEAELSAIADAGQLTPRLAQDLGQSIAAYHHRAPIKDSDGYLLIHQIVAELDRVLAEMQDVFGQVQIQKFLSCCAREQARLQSIMTRRSQAGWVRRCHGDLHLQNIVIWQGMPTPFDALEFDETLGTCDVLYDLAFLLMDLAHRDLHPAANRVLNAYLYYGETDDHLSGLTCLPLFLAIRAGIRAMVDVQTAAVHGDATVILDDARAFMRQALDFMTPPPARLVAVGGLSGSGKTTIARDIAHRLGAFPGAVHLRSDLERKAHFGVPPEKALLPEAYAPVVTGTIYQIMRAKARLALAAGQSVLLDAVHATAEERDLVERIARDAGCPFHGLWLDAETDVRVSRVAKRGPDASDADEKVARRQDSIATGKIGWRRIDASGSPAAVAADVMAFLSA